MCAGLGSGSLPHPIRFSKRRYRIGIGWQTFHRRMKDKPLLVDRECMGGEITSRSRRTHNHDNLRPLVTGNIGDHNLFNCPIAGSNLTCPEKSGFILWRCGVIEPQAEATDGASLKIPFGDDGRLSRRQLDLRDEAPCLGSMQSTGRKQG